MNFKKNNFSLYNIYLTLPGVKVRENIHIKDISIFIKYLYIKTVIHSLSWVAEWLRSFNSDNKPNTSDVCSCPDTYYKC